MLTLQPDPPPADAPARPVPPPGPAICVRGLHKRHGATHAVRGIDLEVARGEVLALLGPNGAGKTSTVAVLEGLSAADAGEVLVLGEDPAAAGPDWRDRVGVVLQEAVPDPDLTVRECLEQHAGWYRRPRDVAETMRLAGIEHRADRRGAQLSGGERRRLDVALALVGDPELVFLDEPTTGFDPAARRAAWDVIAGLRDLGVTVVLTTHYLEEAERLADRIVVLREGVVAAQGTPATLGARDRAAATISYRDADGKRVDTPSADLVADLHDLTTRALSGELVLDDLQVARPSLEDVYLDITTEA